MYRYLWKRTILAFFTAIRIPMKVGIPHLLLFLLLVGCKKDHKLTFEPLVLDKKDCADCPKVSINLPKALDGTKFAQTINGAIEEEIISLLHFDDGMDLSTIDSAIVSFNKGYLELKNAFADEPAGWEADIKGELVYEDAALLTIELNSYIFTGGAHGYSSKRFLNFDKKKGKELENWQLFKNQEDFEQFAEVKFREQEAIPSDKSINHTGLMFERDSFHLPENIGFTEEGVKLLYNPYEVAAYADGPIVLMLPFKEVKPYLAAKVKS